MLYKNILLLYADTSKMARENSIKFGKFSVKFDRFSKIPREISSFFPPWIKLVPTRSAWKLRWTTVIQLSVELNNWVKRGFTSKGNL